MSNNMEEKNSMELEAAKIAMAILNPDRDYHMSFTRGGTIITMTIKEQPGGNIPAEKLFRHSVPKDILDLESSDGFLDDVVYDSKSYEAGVINNQGFIEQLKYLLASNGADWNFIRRSVGMEEL